MNRKAFLKTNVAGPTPHRPLPFQVVARWPISYSCCTFRVHSALCSGVYRLPGIALCVSLAAGPLLCPSAHRPCSKWNLQLFSSASGHFFPRGDVSKLELDLTIFTARSPCKGRQSISPPSISSVQLAVSALRRGLSQTSSRYPWDLGLARTQSFHLQLYPRSSRTDCLWGLGIGLSRTQPFQLFFLVLLRHKRGLSVISATRTGTFGNGEDSVKAASRTCGTSENSVINQLLLVTSWLWVLRNDWYLLSH